MASLLHGLEHVSPAQICFAVSFVWLLYVLCISIYRLFFHPLSHIPGPKLAALTQWVEIYYECFKQPGGQFMWEYQKWHDKYGPIVRIGPNEVHIQDIRFHEILYANTLHSNKPKYLSHRFNVGRSIIGTSEHSLHRIRRTAINPFFSKRKIDQHSPHIQHLMDQVCERVRSEFVQNGAVLNVENMWGAFSADTVVGYCLEQSYGFIMKPGFRAEFPDAVLNVLDTVHIDTHFRWMLEAFNLLPERLIAILSPPMASIHAFMEEMRKQILCCKSIHASGEKNSAEASVFTALLESDLPPNELDTERLQQEAMGVIAAGIETTRHCLSVALFHVVNNARILSRLKTELKEAIPDPQDMPDINTLMQLPYLTCVITESLRLAYGPTIRNPRLSPTPLMYSTPDADYHLPVGSVISMDNYTASHDPWAFPDPSEFRPERWEGNPRAPDGKPLTTYVIAFGRGTRGCLGMQLAYAEVYIGLATFLRRFECELFETERDTVDCYYDRFIPKSRPGTKGVRMKVFSI